MNDSEKLTWGQGDDKFLTYFLSYKIKRNYDTFIIFKLPSKSCMKCTVYILIKYKLAHKVYRNKKLAHVEKYFLFVFFPLFGTY